MSRKTGDRVVITQQFANFIPNLQFIKKKKKNQIKRFKNCKGKAGDTSRPYKWVFSSGFYLVGFSSLWRKHPEPANFSWPQNPGRKALIGNCRKPCSPNLTRVGYLCEKSINGWFAIGSQILEICMHFCSWMELKGAFCRNQ